MGFARASLFGPIFVLLLCLFNSIPGAVSQNASCPTTLTLANGTGKAFEKCQNLPVQGATFSWNYFPGANSTNGSEAGGTLDLAYSATLLTTGGWIGWGINPSVEEMAGSSVLIAFTNSSGGSIVLPFKLDSTLESTGRSDLATGPTDLDILESSVVIDASSLQTTIFAVLQLKSSQTNLIQVWNRGRSVNGLQPQPHDISDPSFTTSVGTIDVSTGTIVVVTSDRNRRENVHAIINAIAWGILLPIGVISARYMRPFGVLVPTWFYIHVFCQVVGYGLGVAGWALGLKLISNGFYHHKHRNIGISLFVLGTVQMFSLVLRPKPDHKFRTGWNVYHYAIGYTIIILSIINIFEGFDLLLPAKGWKHAYIGIIIGLGALALLLEFITWAVWVRRKKYARQMPERIDIEGKGSPRGPAANGTGNGTSS